PLIADGLAIVINGTAQTGDRFLIRPTHGAAGGMQALISDPARIAAASLTPPTGPGDNRNALAMAEALKQPLLDGGTLSVHAAATRLVGRVGIAASQAQANLGAQQTIQQEAAAALDSVRGVNLDEEAANLLRYQQAYQA